MHPHDALKALQNLSHAARSLYHALHLVSDGEVIATPKQELAAAVGISKPTILRSLKELEAARLVSIRRGLGNNADAIVLHRSGKAPLPQGVLHSGKDPLPQIDVSDTKHRIGTPNASRARARSSLLTTTTLNSYREREEKRRDSKSFSRYWDSSWRRGSKRRAQDAWLKHVVKERREAEAWRGMARAMRSAQWLDGMFKNNGAYIPSLENFLENLQWHDDVVHPPWLRNGATIAGVDLLLTYDIPNPSERLFALSSSAGLHKAQVALVEACYGAYTATREDRWLAVVARIAKGPGSSNEARAMALRFLQGAA